MAEIVIRDTRREDVASLRECVGVVARERRYLALVDAPTLEESNAFVSRCIERLDPHLVALDGDRVVGWCDCPGLSTREGFRHVGHLGMGVLPGYRSQGIGRRLLTAVIERATTRGFTRVELEVFASNRPAIALYEALGFVHEGARKNARLLDGRYEDILIMARLTP